MVELCERTGPSRGSVSPERRRRSIDSRNKYPPTVPGSETFARESIVGRDMLLSYNLTTPSVSGGSGMRVRVLSCVRGHQDCGMSDKPLRKIA